MIAEKDRSRFRNFGDALGAALKQFDNVKEWADLIKALQGVQRVRLIRLITIFKLQVIG